MKSSVSLQRKLNTFDVTSLVVGSIVGADIYIAAAIGAKLVGPASLLVWILAGAMAIIIALSFAYCSAVRPKVGGPYSYAREVSSPFAGFTVGWALLLAEWLSLAVFPVAFVQYSTSLFSVNGQMAEIGLKGLFIAIVLGTNIVGVKLAGRVNDALTVVKLSPLLLLMVAGLGWMAFEPGTASANFHPFVTGNVASFGHALVLIFWAYAGFELSTLPADEIDSPRRTIPKAIITGMMIVVVFYLLTNLVIIGSVSETELAGSKSPLMDSASEIFGSWSGLEDLVPLIIGFGALISILGADESGTIGTSRLAYALSLDGLMPRSLSTIHKRFQTPFVAIGALCITAFIASVFGNLVQLINASVFLLAFVYLATCISAIQLRRKESGRSKLGFVIPVAGAILSLSLMVLVDINQILISAGLLIVGVPIYMFFSPKKELHELKASFLSREAVLRRAYQQGERFLAYPLRRLVWLFYRRTQRTRPWVIGKPPMNKS